jgi:predicted nucleotidyltransferase
MAAPTIEALRERRTEIESIARAHGATRIRVFGSVARGDASETSDLDLLVDLDEGRGLFDLGALLMDLRDILGCEVDVATEGGLRPRVAQRVLADAIDL